MFKHHQRPTVYALLNLLLITWLGGCTALGGMGTEIQGNYYLNNEDYQAGVRSLRDIVQSNPDDPAAQYYLGRCLLALDKPAEALPHLELATRLEPGRADYHFWQGVAHWGVMDYGRERSSYLRAIDLDKSYLPAHLYLGHNYLDAGQTQEALQAYEVVLRLDSRNPEALHNRALCLRKMGREKEEIKAWKTYLEFYPDGSLAREAADYINEKGDFSYRNQILGVRPVTLEWIRFESGTSNITREAEPTLRAVGSVLDNGKTIKLEIHSFYKGNKQLAQERGQRVKDFLVNQYSLDPERLVVRSYGRAEKIPEGNRIYFLDHSVVFHNRGR